MTFRRLLNVIFKSKVLLKNEWEFHSIWLDIHEHVDGCHKVKLGYFLDVTFQFSIFV